MNYVISTIKENKIDRYILQNDGNYYSISKLLFDILSEFNQHNDYKITSKKIQEKNPHEINVDERFIEDSIKEVNSILNNKKEDKLNYINNKFVIVKEDTSTWLYKKMSLIFKENTFVFTFIILSTLSIFFFYYNRIDLNKVYYNLNDNFSFINILTFYAIFFIIIFFHEIGHAASSFSFGVKPKEIGFGLYFIFPVLYTNTTNIWKLNRDQRIIVNLGGIYIQLFINIVFIILYVLQIGQNFTLSLIILNTLSILTSFNPFFRYDGYWIYSDFFNIPNLREKSGNLINNIFFHPVNTAKQIKQKQIPSSLLIYSFLSVVFWGFVYYSILKYAFKEMAKIYRLFANGGIMSFNSLESIFMLLIIFFGIYNLYKNIIKN